MATRGDDQFWVKVFVVTTLSLLVLIPLMVVAFIVFFADDLAHFGRM